MRTSPSVYSRCMCHGAPPTSAALQPGGGGARFGSAASSNR